MKGATIPPVTWPDIWYGDSQKARFLRAALTPASLVYAGGWSIYRWLYDAGVKKAVKPYSPVLVVGNLTVGGSGKTPVTVAIASEILAMGREVVIGCSGYGSPKQEGATLATEGPLDPSVWGDEASLFRALLPVVPLIVGRNRVRAAELASQFAERRQRQGGPRPPVLLMDDGFQHLPLRKTASILLDPASSNHRCLPAGPYREPWANLTRADLVIGTLAGEFWLNNLHLGFERLRDFGRGAYVELKGMVDVVCAIGRPAAFVSALEDLGLRIGEVTALPDHGTFSNVRWDLLHEPIVVTAKDAVKLMSDPRANEREIFVARHEVSVEPADAFRARLQEMIGSS